MQGSKIFVSLNSRLESNNEAKRRLRLPDFTRDSRDTFIKKPPGKGVVSATPMPAVGRLGVRSDAPAGIGIRV